MWNNFSLTNSPDSNSDLPQANATVLPKSVAASTDPEGFMLLVGKKVNSYCEFLIHEKRVFYCCLERSCLRTLIIFILC